MQILIIWNNSEPFIYMKDKIDRYVHERHDTIADTAELLNTQRPLFYRWHFDSISLDELLYFDSNFTECCSFGPNK